MEWIPIAEQLPQESCDCIVQVNTIYQGKVVKSLILLSSFSMKYQAFNCFDWQTSEEAEGSGLCGVVAWMPIPEIYVAKELQTNLTNQ